MSHFAVFGLGWGDEGKGKVVDLLCPGVDVVVRYNGGANAGHTVWVGDEKFALHLLPTGILHSHCDAVIGPGVVVDPVSLMSELDALRERGMVIGNRLWISDRAHMVMPYHKVEDRLSDRDVTGEPRIGTTAQGIGPCYADKMRRRSAVRFCDLLHDEELEGRVARIVEGRKVAFRSEWGDDGALCVEDVLDMVRKARRELGAYVTDTTAFLSAAADSGRTMLFEGANGLMLDVDHGTYPFVTSSGTGPHGIGAGAGVPVSVVDRVVGVTKAYATRVGGGPFVTELEGELGERIRRLGNEFGTTTGRPRRVGWFDAVAARHAIGLCRPTDMAMMHLDTLSGFDSIGICTAYLVDDRRLDRVPADPGTLARCRPEIEYVSGWRDNVRGVKRWEDLPVEAKAYVARIESLLGVPATLLGVGPDRSETILRGDWIDLIGSRRPTNKVA